MNQTADAENGFGTAALAAVLIALAGCSSSRVDSYTSSVPAAPSTRVTAAPLAPADAAREPVPTGGVAMTGRWTLAANTGACGLNFRGAPNAVEGTIAPEGGCPGRFYTSRQWTLEQGALVIRDHQRKTLAQFAMASPMRFVGQAKGGMQLSLSR